MQSEILLEGARAVEGALDCDWIRIRSIHVEKGRHSDLIARCRAQGLGVEVKDRSKLEEITGYPFHRGIVARADRPASLSIASLLTGSFRRLVVLEGITDPGNIGTLIRNSAAFGFDAVLVSRNHGGDPWAPKSIRASATAIFRIPVLEVEDLAAALDQLRESRWITFATSLRRGASRLDEIAVAECSVVMFGTEESGLSDRLERRSDERIRIPMSSEIESINVASAAAIVLHRFAEEADFGSDGL
ncbi:MAG: RNA methyltransferase [Verrucomicrobiota bacterium]